MAIQTKVTGTAEYGKYMRVLLGGDPGSGKTLMSSTFPNPYYLSAEGGLMSVARKFLPYLELTKTDDLREVLTLLRQEPATRGKMLGAPGPVDTIVVDTIDEVSKLFMKERLTARNIEAFDNYKDWGWLGDKVESVIRAFRNLPLNVVFTVHLKQDKDEGSGEISFLPNLYGQTSRFLPGAVDLAFALQSRSSATIVEGKSARSVFRYAQTYQDNKYPWAKDRSGRVSHEFPINFEDDYDRLFTAIYGGMDAEFAEAEKKHARPVPPVERPDPMKTDDAATEAEFKAFAEQTTHPKTHAKTASK